MNTELHKQLVDACEMYVMLKNYNTAIENLNNSQAEIVQKYNRYKAQGIKIGGGIACVLVFSILICTFLMLFLIFLGFQTITPDSNVTLAIIRVFSPFLLVPVPLILALLYKSIVGKKKRKKREEEVAKYYREVFVPARDTVCRNINGLTNERNVFLEHNKHVLDFVPEHYRTNLAVAFMEQAVKTGRADTLKEALNLFEEQLHRWNMESYAQQMCEQRAIETAMMNEHLSRIAENQGRMVSALRNIESLEFYNTFCR